MLSCQGVDGSQKLLQLGSPPHPKLPPKGKGLTQRSLCEEAKGRHGNLQLEDDIVTYLQSAKDLQHSK